MSQLDRILESFLAALHKVCFSSAHQGLSSESFNGWLMTISGLVFCSAKIELCALKSYMTRRVFKHPDSRICVLRTSCLVVSPSMVENRVPSASTYSLNQRCGRKEKPRRIQSKSIWMGLRTPWYLRSYNVCD